MARPKKKGLEYFPMDVTFFSDTKCRRLLRRCGTDSIAVYIQLLTEIYKQGYWLAIDEDTAFLVSEQVRMEEDDVKSIMSVCIEVGLFDKDIYAKHGVLTSRGIQSRYQSICKQCGRACDIEEYTLISSEETPINSEETPVSSEETPINSEETPVSCPKSTQSKVKEKKVKKEISSSTTRVRIRDGDFLTDFLSREQQVEALCMQLRVDKPTLEAVAREVMSEWQLTEQQHQDYNDAARHMISQLRIKINAKQNGNRNNRASPATNRMERVRKAAELVSGIYADSGQEVNPLLLGGMQ